MSNEAMVALRQFIAERDGGQIHSPANLAKSISIEAGELLGCFQWSDEADPTDVLNELADVLTYCFLLAEKLGVDPHAIVLSKLEETRNKYPVEVSRGRSTKGRFKVLNVQASSGTGNYYQRDLYASGSARSSPDCDRKASSSPRSMTSRTPISSSSRRSSRSQTTRGTPSWRSPRACWRISAADQVDRWSSREDPEPGKRSWRSSW